MLDNWSFGRKIGAGFAAVVALTPLLSGFALYTTQNIVTTYENVVEVSTRALQNALRLDAMVETHISVSRAYLLTQNPTHLNEKARITANIEQLLREMRAAHNVVVDLAPLDQAWLEYVPASAAQQRYADAPIDQAQMQKAIDELGPFRQRLKAVVETLVTTQNRQIEQAVAAAEADVSYTRVLLVAVSALGVLLAAFIATWLTRVLGRQIGSAVSQMQSSSAELQAAAGQQVSGLREQATAMAEVTTTINELLATSRQIAESSKQVAQLASETAAGAKAGNYAVEQSRQAIAAISKQVDQIVTYMVELGRKSQHIGTVLDLLAELAEQTNILAINATIEATGAGDAGRRFLVVADEIRKLADRVTNSAKDIRTQIEDVRGAVSTTVMATEMGAKAVESGSRQFDELNRVFSQIVDLVRSTTESAREIELSTKQQASAVEQVNVAVSSIAQATREGEASSSQTLQTAAQLSKLSKELVRVVSVGATN